MINIIYNIFAKKNVILSIIINFTLHLRKWITAKEKLTLILKRIFKRKKYSFHFRNIYNSKFILEDTSELKATKLQFAT